MTEGLFSFYYFFFLQKKKKNSFLLTFLFSSADLKYRQKYKELKKRIREIEEVWFL
jgi:hypothetical protein